MNSTADACEFLQPTAFRRQQFGARSAISSRAPCRAREGCLRHGTAIRLFDAVRDEIRYNPFDIGTTADEYRASHIAGMPSNYCVPKAILLTAALRAAGIPAAVGFADVRNHLNSPKLAELMGTDLFIYHGYVALWLDGRMFKVTPAFNTEMCERFGVRQLIFDGKSDALFHEFDAENHRHMEYVNDRGWFADPPIGPCCRIFARPIRSCGNRARIA